MGSEMCIRDSEYDYFVKVGDSNTAVILASTASEEEASAAFNSTVISLEE